MDFTIENRQIKPAVYPIFQNENDTTVLDFVLDSYIHDDTIDLRNYKAYAVTSINGLIDITELESVYDESADTLTVSWNVQEYSLREPGAIQYQVVFKENTEDGENTAVYYSNKAILMNRQSINADDHITANYPTLLKQWIDRINQLSGDADKGFFYIPYGEVLQPSERLDGTMYWQWDNADNTIGHFEDDDGNVLTFSQYKEKTKYLANQDLLGAMTNIESADQHYFTAGANIQNAPVVNSYCLVKQYDTEFTNRFIQEVQVPDNNNVVRTFVRCVTGHADQGINKVGEWRELATTENIATEIKIAMPAGSVIAFAGNNTPTGYLLCDGSAVSRTTYAELFNAIGTLFGAGDGSTTFNLPNLTDRFIQGSETSGTVKEAGLPGISGTFYAVQASAAKGAFSAEKIGFGDPGDEGTCYNGANVTFDASKSNSIYGNSTTVQPPAVTMKYCIKY